MSEESSTAPAKATTNERVTLVEVSLKEVKHQVNGIDNKLDTLIQRQSEGSQTNWGLILSALGFVAILIGGAWAVINIQATGQLSPIKSDVEALKVTAGQLTASSSEMFKTLQIVVAQNADSARDRGDMHSRVDRLTDSANLLQTQYTLLLAKFTEVETQFNADAQLRNVQFSEQQQKNQVLWNASALGKIAPAPTGPFYQPNISQHNSDGHE